MDAGPESGMKMRCTKGRRPPPASPLSSVSCGMLVSLASGGIATPTYRAPYMIIPWPGTVHT